MRKRLMSPILHDRLPFDGDGLDLANLGTVEITSEDEAYPIGCALLMSYQQQISVTSKRHGDMHDLTEQVTSVVNASGIQAGTVNVFNVGSTSAIGTIEFEPGLQHDLPAILDKLIPPSRNYGHEQAWHDGNGHSHLQATGAITHRTHF
jgi:secondary thiamine-phosphate synthase enzyme